MSEGYDLGPGDAIKYVIHEDEDIEPEKIERYVEMFFKYLNDFISKENLRGDIVYCFENGRVIGAKKGDELIGAVAGVYTPFFEKFHIAHIVVEERYRRKGIGAELIRRVIPAGKEASVHLNKENPEIKRFYEEIGFTETHTRFIKESDKEG